MGTALTLGGVLAAFAAVPVVIHLINMMRHRRVKWAAMDFLLASYKKHRNWIWLKQLLLLLARMATMVLIAIMLSVLVHGLMNDLRKSMGWDEGPLAKLLGGKTTHHYVLVDDSFSMTDRAIGTTVFDRANQAVDDIARQASHYQNQRLTLIRFSQATRGSGDLASEQIEDVADLNAVAIDKELKELDERRNIFQVTQQTTGSVPALKLVKRLIEQRTSEKAIVYVVSDFRAKEWDNPAEIRESMEKLKQQNAEIQLVNCVKQSRANLAITDISPRSDIRAAGVPTFVNVSVKNFGVTTAKELHVQIRTLSFDKAEEGGFDPKKAIGYEEETKTVLFSEVQPGQTVTQPVHVLFTKPGKHVIQAKLAEDKDDSVSTDNVRLAVVDVLEGAPVLIIEGDAQKRNAKYLTNALAPGRRETGIRPEVKSIKDLRDATAEQLAAYHTIYLLSVDQLDDRGRDNLIEYVRNGGTAVITVGPHVNTSFYNVDLYREGQGLLPVSMGREVALESPRDEEEKTPDILATDHPVFEAVSGERNSFFNWVSVYRYIKPDVDWNPELDPNVTVLASLRSGDPFVVEKRFGDGRVVMFTSSIAPRWDEVPVSDKRVWHNWTRNPTFIVIALKLQSYLTTSQQKDSPMTVGGAIQRKLKTDKYRDTVKFVMRQEEEGEEPLIVNRAARRSGPVMTALYGRGHEDQRPNGETDTAGVYEAWARMVDGTVEVERFALNIDASEGDLEITDERVLLTKLEQLKPTYLHWDQINPDPMEQAGFNLSKWVLLILILVLVAEQFLAYLCSFHPTARAR